LIRCEDFTVRYQEIQVKRKSLWVTLLVVAMVALILVGPYLFGRGGREYSSDLSQLRAQFNQDKGKVRLLLLLSPT
jgi:hypothetical protein